MFPQQIVCQLLLTFIGQVLGSAPDFEFLNFCWKCLLKTLEGRCLHLEQGALSGQRIPQMIGSSSTPKPIRERTQHTLEVSVRSYTHLRRPIGAALQGVPPNGFYSAKQTSSVISDDTWPQGVHRPQWHWLSSAITSQHGGRISTWLTRQYQVFTCASKDNIADPAESINDLANGDMHKVSKMEPAMFCLLDAIAADVFETRFLMHMHLTNRDTFTIIACKSLLPHLCFNLLLFFGCGQHTTHRVEQPIMWHA